MSPADNREPPAHVTRADREKLLGQHACVVWLTGLSGSGKTTIARSLEVRLADAGRLSAVLDGDLIRTGLNRGLGFSEQDRQENIRRIAEVARLLIDTGVIAIVSVISPTEAMRDSARQIIGAGDLLLVYVRCPLEVCQQRDVKGLYGKARAGQLPQFTGIGAPYEPPRSPDIVIDTDRKSVQEAVDLLLAALADRQPAPAALLP